MFEDYGELELAVDGFGMPVDSDDVLGAFVDLRNPFRSGMIRWTGIGGNQATPKNLTRLMGKRKKLIQEYKATAKSKKSRRRKLRNRIRRLNSRIRSIKKLAAKQTRSRTRAGKKIGRRLRRMKKLGARKPSKKMKKLKKRISPRRRAAASIRARAAWIARARAKGWRMPPAGFMRGANYKVRMKAWQSKRIRATYWRKFRASRAGQGMVASYRPVDRPMRNYRPIPLPYRSYRPAPMPMTRYMPITPPQPAYIPGSPAARQYAPVIGMERPTSHTYTTARARQKVAQAEEAAGEAEALDSDAAEAEEGSSKLVYIGAAVLVAGGVFWLNKKGKKEASKKKSQATKAKAQKQAPAY
jgi:hypothetical protein